MRNLAADAPLLYSARQSDRLLKVAKGTSMALYRGGVLRGTPWIGGRVRFSLEELQRLAREGVTPTGRPSRRRVKGPAGNVAEAIRAIDLGAL